MLTQKLVSVLLALGYDEKTLAQCTGFTMKKSKNILCNPEVKISVDEYITICDVTGINPDKLAAKISAS